MQGSFLEDFFVVTALRTGGQWRWVAGARKSRWSSILIEMQASPTRHDGQNSCKIKLMKF